MSPVTGHMSRVTSHLSHVTYANSHYFLAFAQRTSLTDIGTDRFSKSGFCMLKNIYNFVKVLRSNH